MLEICVLAKVEKKFIVMFLAYLRFMISNVSLQQKR